MKTGETKNKQTTQDDEVQYKSSDVRTGRVLIETAADPAWGCRRASLWEETTKWSMKVQVEV